MTQFQEGQEVEVMAYGHPMVKKGIKQWRRGKIVANALGHGKDFWVVFPDGSQEMFGKDEIRAL